MIIKERKYKKCSCCKQNIKVISEEAYGCDVCKKEINYNNPDRDYLRIRVHYKEKESMGVHLCSWKCAFKKIKEIIKKKESDYFFELPYVSFDMTQSGCTPVDFLKELK